LTQSTRNPEDSEPTPERSVQTPDARRLAEIDDNIEGVIEPLPRP